MGRDFEKEIDEIKRNIKEMASNIDMKAINRQISNTVQDILKSFNFKADNAENEETNNDQRSESDSTETNSKTDYTESNKTLLKQVQDNQKKMREANNNTGYISYCGNYTSSSRESRWVTATTNTDDLLALIENKSAVKVLNCIGNSMRLDILLAIMKKPMTVAQLVEHFGSNSTGQIYHHLGPLITADLIVEDENNKGLYIVQPHRVQGIIMMLAGINDMIDTKYTEGDWNPES